MLADWCDEIWIESATWIVFELRVVQGTWTADGFWPLEHVCIYTSSGCKGDAFAIIHLNFLAVW